MNKRMVWFAYGFFGALLVWAAIARPVFWTVIVATAVAGAVAFKIWGGPWPAKKDWLYTTFGVLTWTLLWAMDGRYYMAALGMVATVVLAALALFWPEREVAT